MSPAPYRFLLRVLAYFAAVLALALAIELALPRLPALRERVVPGFVLGEMAELRSAQARIAYLGDSVAGWIDPGEPGGTRLPELLAAKSGRHVVAVVHAGDGPAVFEAQLRFLARNAIEPERIVLAVNLRAFSPMWEGNPSWNFGLRRRLLDSGRVLPWRALGVFKYPFGRLDERAWHRTPVWVAGRRVGTLIDLEAVPPETRYVSPEIVPGRLRVRYATDVTRSRGLGNLRRALDLLVGRGFAHLVYLTPVDLEAAERSLPPAEYAAVTRNLDVLREVLREAGVRWLDLSHAVSHDRFSDLYAPTEHLVLAGRESVAARIAQAIR